ncbi:GNAT family N-acetyltransferase [Nitratireductor sp. ZSWI3]|uniref:GNAT family N-acetyltransferase n=1 Tax=Nitratireductor sp. ZSWI3 TaxID=2966359 RepID=UPI00214FA76C|nr:GNAT family N-acetyltransferase [Nitratireductor sp. ZSWI3]MCR4268720.1 GNAT family N-acetyltransferase [Nitratireductor sp. ZSWI3]
MQPKNISHHELLIRLARPEDASTIHAAILDLAAHLGETDKVIGTVEDFRRFGFGDEPAFTCLIAETGDAFAGLSLFFPMFSTWLGKPGVYVQDLYVDPRFRRRGIGERLLCATAAWSGKRGGAYLRLAVDAGNETAHAFYEKLGIGWLRADRSHAAYGAAFRSLAQAGATISEKQVR